MTSATMALPGKPAVDAGALPKAQEGYRPFGAFRLGLALLVVLSHALFLGPQWLVDALKTWALGTLAVMSFFVLSGFIIADALERYYRDRIGAFLANRLLRLLPPYLAALAFSVAVHALLVAYAGPSSTRLPEGMFSLQTIAHNLALPFVSFGPSPPAFFFVRYIWAVSIELWFYALFGLAFFFCLRLRAGERAAAMVFIGALLAAYLARRSGVTWLYPIRMTPYFLLGIAIFYVVRDGGWLPVVGATLSAVASALHIYDYYGRTEYGGGAAIALLAIALFMAAIARVTLSSGRRSIDQALGDISYPLYLNHFVLVSVAQAVWTWRGWLSMIACIGLSIGLAALLNLAVEPFTRGLRDRLRGVAL